MNDPIKSIMLKDESVFEVFYDTDAMDPREEFDYCTEEDLEAWEDGRVYGFVVHHSPLRCKCCGHTQFTEDSCWGFYGEDWEGMLDHVPEEYHRELREELK